MESKENASKFYTLKSFVLPTPIKTEANDSTQFQGKIVTVEYMLNDNVRTINEIRLTMENYIQ